MATITIRVDDERRQALEEAARDRGETVSDVVRGLIDALLTRAPRPADELDAPVSLPLMDRLVLTKLDQILVHLAADDKERDTARTELEVLAQGYTGEYGDVFGAVSSGELPMEQCRLVWDILDMFTAVDCAVGILPGPEVALLTDADRRHLRFGGFDQNDRLEAAMLRYVRFLLANDRWENLMPHLEEVGDRGNSHGPRLASYQRMLATYSRMVKDGQGNRGHFEYRLNASELQTIAASYLHPAGRR